MTIEAHADMVASAIFYHIKNISSIRNYLTHEAAGTLVHANVTSRQEYSNALVSDLSDRLLYKIRKGQNAAARVVTGTYKFEQFLMT